MQKDNKVLGMSTRRRAGLKVALAETSQEVRECLRLRYDIFSREMGAKIGNDRECIDQDKFDDFCSHLMVVDVETSELVATTRLLTNSEAAQIGHFYSETEFDLSNVLSRPGTFMEVGRTCIHPDYRNGAGLAMLWHGIAKQVAERKIDYLMGCASIPLSGGDRYVAGVMKYLRDNHFSHAEMRVTPRVPVANLSAEEPSNVIVPTLLKGYLKQGAQICGEPYWDAEFGVADVFVLLSCEKIASRYMRHFVERIA